MVQLTDILTSYVPWLVARYFINHPDPLTEPRQEEFEAAVLFADISGFSKLARHLSSEESVAGPERLTQMLNGYFGTLIDIIWEHGGDIVKFAGDGIYAVWPSIAQDRDIGSLAQYAVQAAWRTQQLLHDHELETGHKLSLRIGISTGLVKAATVGGVLKRWEFLLAGSPIGQVNIASEIAERGQIVVSEAAASLLSMMAEFEATRESDFLRVTNIKKSLPQSPIPQANLSEAAVTGLKGFVAGAITTRISANQVGWLAEIRRISVIFLSIKGLTQNADDVIERIQDIMRAMQVTLYRYEGSVRQFIIDDKGTVFIAAFGVPPLTHEDDAIRAVKASIALKAKLSELGYEASIGIATGTAFCGPVGNQLRREYAMVGDVVVLAARLMGQASEGQIFVDRATYTLARTRIKFNETPARRLKGYENPVPIFIPQEGDLLELGLLPIIGRDQEMKFVAGALQGLQGGDKQNLIIRGEAGVGKSRLVTELRSLAHAQRIQVLSGKSDFLDRATPYHSWREVLSRIFQVDNFTKTRSRSLTILAKLASDPELSRLAPLLNAVLPLDIPENEDTEAMSGEARAENSRWLLLQLLRLHVAKKPAVVVLEDAHWMDSASWALALLAAQQIDNLMIVVVMRPMSEIPSELTRLLADSNSITIDMQSLSIEETAELVGQHLEAVSVAPAIVSLIYQRSGGNPMFSEQLAFALRDAEYIESIDGDCHFKPDLGNLGTLTVPDTIQDVMTARIDRLAPDLQLCLKVASVIGEAFLLQTLIDVFPIERTREQIVQYVQELLSLSFIYQTSSEPAYQFRQIVTREVAYNVMLFSQRKALHSNIARWYERNFVYDLSPYYALLAYHWQKAEEKSKTIEYLDKAAEQAMRNAAYREVVDFLSDATTLAPENSTRRIRWSGMLGEAYWGIGDLAGSRTEAEAVLHASGNTLPSTASELSRSILWQVMKQVAHRLVPSYFIGRRSSEINKQLRVLRAYHRLQEVFYFSNDRPMAFYTGFCTLNLAERLGGPPSDLATAYANAAIGMSIVGLVRVADRYGRLAVQRLADTEDRAARALVHTRLGLYQAGIARWGTARQHFEESILCFDEIEDKRGLGDALTALGFAELLHGDLFYSESLFAQLHEVAMANNNKEHIAWSSSGRGNIALYRGNTATAIEFLQSSTQLLEAVEDRVSYIHNLGILAIAYYQDGNYAGAFEACLQVQNLTKIRRSSISYVGYGGYANVPLVAFLLWQKGYSAEAEAVFHTTLRKLEQFSSVFPIAKARLLLLRALDAWQKGKRNKAQKLWNKTYQQAEQQKLLIESLLARQYLVHYTDDMRFVDNLSDDYRILGVNKDAQELLLLERVT